MSKAILICVLTCVSQAVRAGDDASGPISYSTDLSTPFTVYRMSERDRAWSRSLVANLKYQGPAIHFVRTSLPLLSGDKLIGGAIYQAIEETNVFYIVASDAVLRIGARSPYSVGSSFHAPRSRNFIVYLGDAKGGIPFLSSTPVISGKVMWNGNDRNRLAVAP